MPALRVALLLLPAVRTWSARIQQRQYFTGMACPLPRLSTVRQPGVPVALPVHCSCNEADRGANVIFTYDCAVPLRGHVGATGRVPVVRFYDLA